MVLLMSCHCCLLHMDVFFLTYNTLSFIMRGQEDTMYHNMHKKNVNVTVCIIMSASKCSCYVWLHAQQCFWNHPHWLQQLNICRIFDCVALCCRIDQTIRAKVAAGEVERRADVFMKQRRLERKQKGCRKGSSLSEPLLCSSPWASSKNT